MSNLTLWQQLQQANLVEGELPPNSALHWSNRLLLGLVGWIAALFPLAFTAMLTVFEQDNLDHILLAGILLLIIAYAINHAKQRGDLKDQFVLVLALAGDGGLLFGLWEWLDNHYQQALTWLALCLLSLAIALLFKHWLLRLFHSTAAALLLTNGLACLGLQLLAPPLMMAALIFCWLRIDAKPAHHQLYHALSIGLTLYLLATGYLYYPISPEGYNLLDELGGSRLPLWLNPLLCAALVLATMVKLRLPLLFGLPLVLISAIIPGMGAGVLVLILGFYAGSIGLMALACLLLLVYGAFYYYDLGLTLMVKSWLLLGSGILLLGARQLLSAFVTRSTP